MRIGVNKAAPQDGVSIWLKYAHSSDIYFGAVTFDVDGIKTKLVELSKSQATRVDELYVGEGFFGFSAETIAEDVKGKLKDLVDSIVNGKKVSVKVECDYNASSLKLGRQKNAQTYTFTANDQMILADWSTRIGSPVPAQSQ